jgi:hypothetical protein
MCCGCCRREIRPGTEQTLWDGVKHWVWVCATCFAFGNSAVFGQVSPPEAAPPIFIDVRAPSIYSNVSAGTFTNTFTSTGSFTGNPPGVAFVSTGPPPATINLPPWASPEKRKARHKLSRKDFNLSPADQARLRKR